MPVTWENPHFAEHRALNDLIQLWTRYSVDRPMVSRCVLCLFSLFCKLSVGYLDSIWSSNTYLSHSHSQPLSVHFLFINQTFNWNKYSQNTIPPIKNWSGTNASLKSSRWERSFEKKNDKLPFLYIAVDRFLEHSLSLDWFLKHAPSFDRFFIGEIEYQVQFWSPKK